MKKYFFSGLATLLPIALTVIIFIFLVDFLTKPFVGIIEEIFKTYKGGILDTLKHHQLLLFISRIFVLILLFLFTIFLGFLAQRFLFAQVFKWMQKTFLKIPWIRGIYRISTDVTKSFVGKTEKIFRETVLVSFPHKEAKALGLLTGDVPPSIHKNKTSPLKSVFVPTSPHPISGFLIMFSESHIEQVDMSTEDAFKFLFSCGIYVPGEKEEN